MAFLLGLFAGLGLSFLVYVVFMAYLFTNGDK